MEELEHALKRNAKIYCEVGGYGMSSDGYHLTKPLESGDGALRAMRAALNDAEINFSDLNHINCHATSTPVGDIAEAKAIFNLLLGEGGGEKKKYLEKVSIGANKGNIGHTFGAAGAIEGIFCILTLKN